MQICNAGRTKEGNIWSAGKDEDMTEEEFLIEMKNFFENINNLKVDLEKQIKETELVRDDLLHELELARLNAVEMTRVTKTLKEVLLERRKYKEELEKVEILKEFTDKYNNKLITGDIIQQLKRLREYKEKLKNRTYRPRRITNLKCVEAKNETNKKQI